MSVPTQQRAYRLALRAIKKLQWSEDMCPLCLGTKPGLGYINAGHEKNCLVRRAVNALREEVSP